MSYELSSALFSVALFAGILLALRLGHAAGRRMSRDLEGGHAGLGVVEGAIFGLMGLLIAFTFSGAASRFDARRELIVEEVNAIGTAWLRIDVLDPADQAAVRERFRAYVDERLAVYREIADADVADAARKRAEQLGGELWSDSVAAVRRGGLPQAPALLLPALNAMFDIATTRVMATEMHPPLPIFGMLFGLSLIASLLAGFAMAGGKRPSWLHRVGFALVMAISTYVILDLEFPRRGLIRVDTFDHALVELRETMN